MLSGLYVARLSALALDGVPGLLGAGDDWASWSSCCAAAGGGVAVLIFGRGLLGGVCRSVCDRFNLVGELGPVSELLEDQAVIKLSTTRARMVRMGLDWTGSKEALQRTSRPRHVRGDSRGVSHNNVPAWYPPRAFPAATRSFQAQLVGCGCAEVSWVEQSAAPVSDMCMGLSGRWVSRRRDRLVAGGGGCVCTAVR